MLLTPLFCYDILLSIIYYLLEVGMTGTNIKNSSKGSKSISVPTLLRMPLYYSCLKAARRPGMENVSCSYIALKLDLTPIQVRKDFESFGAKGRPKIGYSVDDLIDLISGELGYDNTSEAFLVGTGNLGKALLGYPSFKEYGLDIIAGFDRDESVTDTKIHGKPVLPIGKFKELSRRMGIRIGVITVPGEQAQMIADMMVESGMEAIWNFAPVHLDVPDEVIVENVNMASSLAVLSNKLIRKM
jgi:redox-sensing transcriptional repressor